LNVQFPAITGWILVVPVANDFRAHFLQAGPDLLNLAYQVARAHVELLDLVFVQVHLGDRDGLNHLSKKLVVSCLVNFVLKYECLGNLLLALTQAGLGAHGSRIVDFLQSPYF
jgi:hypothetical protein